MAVEGLSQLTTKIDGVDVHFIHVRSKHPKCDADHHHAWLAGIRDRTAQHHRSSRNTATSAARLYWENKGRSPLVAAVQKTSEISLPVAISVFPGEIYRAPETWARRAYPNLIYFNEVDRGGHFAAWEEPELFAAELRAAFKSLRK